MSAIRPQPLRISAADARRLFMSLQGLCDDPARPGAGKPAALAKLVRRLGFVQIDTINVVDRAHHLILSTRAVNFTPAALDQLTGPRRALFEHWTHDASFIPTDFFAYWRPRFERAKGRSWHRTQLGDDRDNVIELVRTRIRNEGPLRSKDFEHAGERGATSWWNWKPAKLALDYLWRIGELYIVGRESFQKVYDLTERAVPHLHAMPPPGVDEHADWACSAALERLGFASATELSRFWNHIDLATARKWMQAAVKSGRAIEVEVESTNGEPPRRAVALPGIARQIKKLPDAPAIARLLCPFDPVIRDRARLHRLFNFDYRFEAFVPAPKRVHGYYVMPILEGDQLVGRVDPKFHRDTGVLEIKKLWWEHGVKVTKARRQAMESAAQRLATAVGARRVIA